SRVSDPGAGRGARGQGGWYWGGICLEDDMGASLGLESHAMWHNGPASSTLRMAFSSPFQATQGKSKIAQWCLRSKAPPPKTVLITNRVALNTGASDWT